ncbi:unnamed protein product [Adineta steineri]|uniref:N-formylglutamate amidohydrolase n=1 Tax=Adineta steineri TaxID=433720 RepID=A0A818XBY3_9BILA|nr:unnamed protein product [Adineta steineri]CAF1082187.1 unnamed protein product [Adineta steineri]CAF3736587.1 unnamed protein product [Adineta steineri]CAF3750920.1 unnamed protein product [Adineta steineri]
MLTWYSLSIIIVLFFIDSSIEQGTLNFLDGYRSSCKHHQQGNVNLIISAPHGGTLLPDDLPNRTIGGCLRKTGTNAGICAWWFNDTCTDGERCNATTVRDTLSDEFAENVANELNIQYQLKPFIVIGKWNRIKIDFNREINEATLNHPEAIAAHHSYHSNIQQAINKINQNFGKGLLLDIHGHSAGNYTMVGYLLTSNQLNVNNLNTLSVTTSIESLCSSNREECIRGHSSFGTALELNNLGIAYPSLANPKPGALRFLSGGYITSNYKSTINTIQTELPYDVRAGNNRRTFARNYAKAIIHYMKLNNLLLSN